MTIVNTQEEFIASRNARIVELETQCKQFTEEVDQQIAHKNSIIASKDTSLQKKEATNQSLNDQLTKTRDYLTNKPQVSLLYH